MNNIMDFLKTMSAFITALTIIGGAVIWVIKKFIFKPNFVDFCARVRVQLLKLYLIIS